MCAQGSQECLKNAEHLFEDATTLLRNGSFGTTQSLMVTAMEEAAKAIILELANLHYIGKEVAEQSMRDHIPKKVVILAMEKGLLFVGNIDRRRGSCIIQRTEIKKFKNVLESEFRNLEKKRQNGFYVNVDVNNGIVVNCPSHIQQHETEEFAAEAESYLNLTKSLCKFLTEYRMHPERSNPHIFLEDLRNFTMVYDEV